jgi:hypothetical protein
MRLSACVLAVAVLSPFAARAQTPEGAPPAAPPPAIPPPPAVVVAPAPPPPPAAPPAKTWKDLVTFEGLVDAYYQYNLTGTTSTTPLLGRQFDVNSNTFTLGYAKVGIGVMTDNVGLRMDLGYGAVGQIINAANPSDASAMAPSPGGSTGEAFVAQQAYATVMPVNNLTFDFGKFVTTAGAEVIEASKNWMYSRSILFFNIPLLHTGARATFKVSDLLTLQASVVNGWNGTGINVDVSGAKTYGVSANITLPVGTNIIATGYFGKGEATGATTFSTDTRVLGDLVVAQTVGPLGLNLNIDYVNDKLAGIDGFIGGALMGHFGVNDHFALNLRLEYARLGDLPTPVTPGHTKEFEGTINGAIPMGGRFEARVEFRVDHADQPVFDGGQDKTQASGTLALLAWF